MTRIDTRKLEIGTIDHGRTLRKANELLAEAADKLIAFVTAHPKDAKGARAKVKLAITISCGGGEQGFEIYGCKADLEQQLPKEPPVAHSLDIEETDGVLELKTQFNDKIGKGEQRILALHDAEIA